MLIRSKAVPINTVPREEGRTLRQAFLTYELDRGGAEHAARRPYETREPDPDRPDDVDEEEIPYPLRPSCPPGRSSPELGNVRDGHAQLGWPGVHSVASSPVVYKKFLTGQRSNGSRNDSAVLRECI